jgi:O-methyltransferase involved in polyketide biosynthesis
LAKAKQGEKVSMPSDEKHELTGVQETLLLPLWARAKESKKKKPLLIDKKAVEIVDNISYDLSLFSKRLNKASHIGFIARSIYFDEQITRFMQLHPEATIVNVGCGLDTTFDRIDNGKIQWIDLDLPEVIDFRNKYISESERRTFIAKSVLDTSWYERIKNRNDVMFLIAGVLEYFSKAEIGQLFNDFSVHCPGVEIIFEYCSDLGIKSLNKSLGKVDRLIKSARITWGMNDISEIGRYGSNISVIDNMTIFKEHRKKYSFLIRLLLSYFDFWKISFLAHVKVN